ncbi:MAG: hypothetical protein M3510_04755 [Actinomycetota bacterium]|nr:hypothetical protein [Actinomycetota bacterium]
MAVELIAVPSRDSGARRTQRPGGGLRSDRGDAVAAVAQQQSGVVSRGQVLAAGLSDEWVTARLTARQWQRVHPGIYATFTGELPWVTRVWAAILSAGQGAAADETALALQGMHRNGRRLDGGVICVAIDQTNTRKAPAGVTYQRVSNIDRHVMVAASIPRLRCESAVLLGAGRRDLDGAVGLVADACQQRLTTPARLVHGLDELPSLRHRRVLLEILADVAGGAYSYLEVQYLRRVERAHGLPTASRQRVARIGRQNAYRDVEYVDLATVAELDGRLGHESFDDRSRDMARDTVTAVGGRTTLRLGYRAVLTNPCHTAALVASVLTRAGWHRRLRRCGRDCAAFGQP